MPYHASQMYAKNIATFLKYLVKDGQLQLDREDEIVRETLVTHEGEVVHPRVREALGACPCPMNWNLDSTFSCWRRSSAWR